MGPCIYIYLRLPYSAFDEDKSKNCLAKGPLQAVRRRPINFNSLEADGDDARDPLGVNRLG